MKRNASVSLWLLPLVAIVMTGPPAVRAEMIGADQALARNQAEQDRAKVESFLDRSNVKERLQAMGVSGVVAKDRVASLSDEEVHALAQRIDSLPAGGRLSSSDIIIILLVAILVVLVL